MGQFNREPDPPQPNSGGNNATPPLTTEEEIRIARLRWEFRVSQMDDVNKRHRADKWIFIGLNFAALIGVIVCALFLKSTGKGDDAYTRLAGILGASGSGTFMAVTLTRVLTFYNNSMKVAFPEIFDRNRPQ